MQLHGIYFSFLYSPWHKSHIDAHCSNLHTCLNRLITSRLPLALPPHTADSSLYTTGLVHFAHVFLTFESLWVDLLRDYDIQAPLTAPSSDPPPASPPTSPLLSYLLVNPYDSPSLFTSTLGAPTPPSPQLLAFLQTLRPRGLIRAARLKQDLACLMDLHPTDLDVLLAKYPRDKVADFCTHIRKTVHEKPWTLVSYAWCFYMAVFSGGRWIRATLLQPGPDFWLPSTQDEELSNLPLSQRGLSFWHFAGQSDGEDIKLDFKARLADAETLFSPDQRIDIIEEAKNIFQLCASLVHDLDELASTSRAEAEVEPVGASRKKAHIEEKPGLKVEGQHRSRPTEAGASTAHITRFIRKPEVTGTLVALACLACVSLWRFQ
jgi:heme oxygenase